MSIKHQIEGELSVLLGERIIGFRRAALMVGVDFGGNEENGRMASGGRDACKTRRYALHVHSPWRLLKESDVCLSQYAFCHQMNGFRRYEENDEDAFARLSSEINRGFKSEAVRVKKVEANELGDLKIYMENEYCLEIFVDSIGNTESWRFFDGDRESGHFVVFDEP